VGSTKDLKPESLSWVSLTEGTLSEATLSPF
jgi:hypothetical protein